MYDYLDCSDQFLMATNEQRADVCNGCGPKGWKGSLVPETIYFLRMTPACDVHDWDYHYGLTLDDKRDADDRFLRNLNLIIEEESSTDLMRWLRRRRARKYYLAVSKVGAGYFLAGKEGVLK